MTAEQIAWHDDQRDLGPQGADELAEVLRSVFSGVVLDAGGGTGGVSAVLVTLGVRPVLLDLSAEMLDAGAHRGLQRVRADLLRVPLASASVDGVHAAYALQNVADWRTAVGEVARVVRPGGPVMVAWGGGRPDPLLQALRRRYLDEVEQWSGTDAERAGLSDVTQADAAMAQAQCVRPKSLDVHGEQVRSVRQIVHRTAANTFRARPPEAERRRAVERTLALAADELGDLDAPRHITVHHRYRLYRRR